MVAYRTSVQESTGATPFSFMFGREARLPIDVMFGHLPGEESTSSSEYAFLLQQQLETAYHRARTHLALQRRQKTLYDRKSVGHAYNAGDLTWLHCPAIPLGTSRKLYRPWQGPYEIVKVITDVLYCIRLIKSPWCCIGVHYNRLKPYQRRDGCGIQPLSPVTIQPFNPQLSPESQSDYDDEPLVILPSQPDTPTISDPLLR